MAIGIGPLGVGRYTDSTHYAVHTDHLNTPRRLTNSAKQVAWQWAFSAFGDEMPTTARNRYVDPATTPNAGTTTVAEVTFNLRYPGQYFDKESNLHYNYFRSYDAKTGRYTQSDPIGLQGGWNRFAYVNGNPLLMTDPTGEFGIVGAGIGAGLEIAAQAYKNYSDGCDLLDVDNYDWWDVGVSAAVGAVAPGAISVGKTAWTSGNAAKTISAQLSRARTPNRVAKLQGRLDAHTGAITEAVATQGMWQGYKFAGKQLDGNKQRDCTCKK